MRNKLFVILALAPLPLLMLTGCGERASEEVAEVKCEMCGMNAAASEGRFILDYEDGTSIQACSSKCASMLAGKQTAKLYRSRVYGTDTHELIDATTATFVIDARILPKGSMPPGVFAFASKEAADKFTAEHGGRAGSLAEMLVWAKEESEPGDSAD